MYNNYNINAIAHIENDFTEKFGIPRQSGLVDNVISKIIFEPEYRVREAFRGIDSYSHLWLLWHFSKTEKQKWNPTVRPPRLGGNIRMGVFATRSPFRPNSIGLSSVKLINVDLDSEYGPILYVAGADILNGTPIIDIKPYLSYTDSHPEAVDGFALSTKEDILSVSIPQELHSKIPEKYLDSIIALLAQDPRPQYQHSIEKNYAMRFGNVDVFFIVNENLLSVTDIKYI